MRISNLLERLSMSNNNNNCNPNKFNSTDHYHSKFIIYQIALCVCEYLSRQKADHPIAQTSCLPYVLPSPDQPDKKLFRLQSW